MGQLGFVQVIHSAVVTGIASFIGCMQEKDLLKLLMNRIELNSVYNRVNIDYKSSIS